MAWQQPIAASLSGAVKSSIVSFFFSFSLPSCKHNNFEGAYHRCTKFMDSKSVEGGNDTAPLDDPIWVRMLLLVVDYRMDLENQAPVS